MPKEIPVHVKPSPVPVGGRRDDRLADVIPALFDTTMLKDEIAILAAIGAVNRYLVDPATPLEEAVVELHSKAPAHVLELVLCAASDDAYRALADAILEGYRRNLESLMSSPAPGLLSRFALCHWFLPDACPPATANTLYATPTLRWKDVEAGTAVLRELSKLSFVGPAAHVRREPSDERHLPLGMKFASSQGERKRARREKDAPPIDQEVFTRYGRSVPQTPVEVRSLTRSICGSQRRALKDYLGVFRRTEVMAAIKNTFLSSPRDIPHEMTKDSEDSICSDEHSEKDAAEPVATPSVYPTKVALLLDSREGFGEWRIFFEQRAIRDLRQARDGKMFSIFVKKIKELSRGHFSEDNQKRLTSVPLNVPIYEAKMTGDTRLLYQVDCDKDPHDGVERQFLRIYGICTHAQIDRRFRDANRHARQLGQAKGAEYKKRCTFRNPPANLGDNVFSPADWRPRRVSV